MHNDVCSFVDSCTSKEKTCSEDISGSPTVDTHGKIQVVIPLTVQKISIFGVGWGVLK